MHEIIRPVVVFIGAMAIAVGVPAQGAYQEHLASVAELLISSELAIVDSNLGRQLGRGVVTHASLPDRCTLLLRINEMEPGTLSIQLGELYFVQGDSGTMVEITTRQERSRSLIFNLGGATSRYAQTVSALSALARRCGAELVGPPPLIRTRPQR